MRQKTTDFTLFTRVVWVELLHTWDAYLIQGLTRPFCIVSFWEGGMQQDRCPE